MTDDLLLTKFEDVPRGGARPGKFNLTQRQEWIWLWMLRYQELKRRPPTIRDLSAVTGVSSTNGIRDHIAALQRKGFVEKPDKANPSGPYVAVDPVYAPTEKALALFPEERK